MRPQDPVLNPDILASLRALDDDPAFFDQLIDLFTGDAMPRVERLRALLSQGDRTGAQSVAHSIRGSAGNIGAAEVSSLAREIELSLEAGGIVADAQAAELARSMQRALDALAAERSHPRG